MNREGHHGFAWRKYSSPVAVLAAGFSFACLAQGAQAATSTPSCAWQYSSLVTNLNWPDSNAQYWVTPFTVQAGLKITVHGAYPSARYFSLVAYNSLGLAGSSNEIHDSQITPRADGSFTVTVSRAAGPNSIVFANAFNGTTGYLVLRVYVPNGAVSLPSVTFSTSSGAATRFTCSAYAVPSTLPPFNNPDNAYVYLHPPSPSGSTVTVISGKAPTSVRYWSLCSYLWTGAAVDCPYDADISLASGYYHVVVGQPAQKPAILAAGYTYLPYGDSGVVMLRNLLGNQTTGDYAPVVKTCALTDHACIGA